MTSVERAFEYAKLTPEAPLESSPGNLNIKYKLITGTVIKLLLFQIRNLP
jgi:hypothetical protein